MKKNVLGRTGLEVTEFCLGLLPMGPGQKDVPREEAVRIIRAAFDAGVNFFDTAKGYRTQPYLGEALEGTAPDEAVIATKSPAKDADGLARDVEEALRELRRDHIDILHLHAARDEAPFSNRAGALERLLRLREEGVVRAAGVSTHYVKVVDEAAGRDDIDVVFPLANITGMGVLDGSPEDMEAAILRASRKGKGVYIMKPLAGGNLLPRFKEALSYARNVPGSSSVSVGVVSMEELLFDLRVFNDEDIDDAEFEKTAPLSRNKRYIVLGGCSGCGICLDECPADAISLRDEKAAIDHSKCILCGYCALACPGFWIRLA